MDFSPEACQALYLYESTGQGSIDPLNGFAVGKRYMDVAVAQWLEDMWVTLWPWELYWDDDLPNWWLDRVLGLDGEKLLRGLREAEMAND